MTQSTDPKRTSPLWLTIVIAVVCVALIILHALVPSIQIDAITIALILLPFIVHFVPSFVEFEGFGLRLRRSDFDKSIDKVMASVKTAEQVGGGPLEQVPNMNGDQTLPSFDVITAKRRSAVGEERAFEFVSRTITELTNSAHSEPVIVPIRLRETLNSQLYLVIEDYFRLLAEANLAPDSDDWKINVLNRPGTQVAAFALSHQILREEEYNAIVSTYQLLNEAIHSEATISTRQALRLIDVGAQALTIIMTKRGQIDPRIAQG